MPIESYELLLSNLFKSKPTVIDQEAARFEYQIEDTLGSKLSFYISDYGYFVAIQLEYKENAIYSVSAENIGNIKVEADVLKIFEHHKKEPIIQVSITPDRGIFLSQFILDNPPRRNTARPVLIGKMQPNNRIEYNDLDLLILFCNEPKILNQEAKMFEYSTQEKHGFKLSLCFAVYDKSATVQLEYENQLIYKIDVSNVARISAEKDKIKIFIDCIEEPLVEVSVVLGVDTNSPLFTLDATLYTIE